MFCNKCGNNISENASFCPKCGTTIIRQVDEPVIEPKKKISKKTIISASVVSVAVIIAVVLTAVFLPGYIETKKMREALDSNNAAMINSVYAQAMYDYELLAKYNELFGEKLDDIMEDINSQDFSESAKENSDDEYEKYVYDNYYDYFVDPDENFSESLIIANEAKWEELFDLVESKESYYIGLHEYANGNYGNALQCFSEVIETDNHFADTEQYIADSVTGYISVVSTDAQAMIDSGDISGGIELLTSAKERIDNLGIDSAEINEMINSTLSTYAAQYAEKAETAFNNKDVDGAIGNINVAIELQPDNAEYKVKLDTYKMYLPFELYYEKNVLMIDDAGVYFAEENEVDVDIANDNSKMYNTFGLYYNSDFADFTYNLNGQYDWVSGTSFVKNSKKSEKGEGYFEAYGDGVLLYTSPTMSAGVLPTDVKFNVSGVQRLTIKMYSQKYGVGFDISNLVAQKAFPGE